MAAVGRTFISAGVLILLFVVYQLWGTNLHEAREQRELRDSFAAALAEQARATDPGPPPPEGTPVTTAPGPPPPPSGEAVAIIRIPKIGVDKAVVEGVRVSDLKKGPGHYPGTPLPGQPGNAAVAGHRTTYGAPFSRLDELAPGDRIDVTTTQGSFTYRVTGAEVVRPDASDVLNATEDNRLTLTTCHPRFSAARRLIVTAALSDEPAPAPPPTTPPAEPAEPDDGDDPEPAPAEQSLDAGLSGESASNGPAVLWGAVCAAIWLLAWLVASRWRKWLTYAMFLPLFLVALYVFFENVARLLPANV